MNGKSQLEKLTVTGFNTQKKYSCIFFDLDHTLWDYERNSEETLLELFKEYTLLEKGVSNFKDFHRQFKKINAELWHLYDHGKINSETIREQRFKQILAAFNLNDQTLIQDLSYQYLHACPKKNHVIPGAIETLEYLKGCGYQLSIITNGFEEIQHMKLASGKLITYFTNVITSQQAGHKKPAREIFDYAMERNEVKAHEAVMIGDNLLTDIAGARNASVDTVYFNPDKVAHAEEVTLEIHQLGELCHHL
jgi:YjjG family noncanonical pyrimidine nucleotidase